LNSAKLYIDPSADKAAYVSSHNSRFKEKNRELRVGVDCEYRLNKNQQNIKELPEPLDVVLEVLFYMAPTFSSQTLDAIHNIIKWKSSKK
jgi:hypothetical protein